MKALKQYYFAGLLTLILFTVLQAGAGFAQDEPVHIHGFISQGYINSSSNNYLLNSDGGSFQFGEIGLNFAKQTNERLRVAAQLLMRNLGQQSDKEIDIDWGFGDYRINDNFGFRAGRIKTPLGLYNQYWDMDFLRTSVFLPNGIYGEENRAIINAWDGVSVYGTLAPERKNSFDYELMYGSTDVPSTLPFLKDIQLSTPGAANLTSDNAYNFMGKIVWNTKIDGLIFGYTNAKGDTDVDFDIIPAPTVKIPVHFDLDYDLDLAFTEYVNDRFKFAAEWMRWDILMTNAATNGKTVNDLESWYALTEYTMNEKINIGAFYSEYYPNRHDKDGLTRAAIGQPQYKGWLKDKCLTLRYNIEENWNVKAEVHFMDGAGKLNSWDNPNGYIQDWTLFVLKTTLNF